MQAVESLHLPPAMPTADAIRSYGHKKHTYEPEFWELEYLAYRYLGRMTDEDLIARYDGIARNLNAIVSDDRHVIPLTTFLSSWYWYRKEHQTRFEFSLRKLRFDGELPAVRKLDPRAPARPRSPNAGDVLFRFGTGWLDDFVELGKTRITPARKFLAMERDPARQDDELAKSNYLPGAYTTITTMDGRVQPTIGDIKRSVGGPDYFAFCMSADWDADLFSDFGADRCVVVRNRDEFERRFEIAAAQQLPSWKCWSLSVEYFDPYEGHRHQYLTSAFSKDFRFAYQREWRLICQSPPGLEAIAHVTLDLGSLTDIAELHHA